MAFDRSAAAAWYRRNRARSRELFDLLAEEAYYSRPIALRHPIVFYEGHLPGLQLQHAGEEGPRRPEHRRAAGDAVRARDRSARDAGRAGQDRREAGGAGRLDGWPARDEVRAFADEADRQVIDAILNADVDQPGHPLLDRAEAVFTILEHEVMHQETLLYMWHRLPFAQKRTPAGYRPRVEGAPPRREWIEIPAGCATLGVRPRRPAFGWDNEHPALERQRPGLRHRAPRRDERALSRVRRRRRLPRSAVVAAGGLGVGAARRRRRTRCSGSATAIAGSGAACSSVCRCPRPGPCT